MDVSPVVKLGSFDSGSRQPTPNTTTTLTLPGSATLFPTPVLSSGISSKPPRHSAPSPQPAALPEPH